MKKIALGFAALAFIGVGAALAQVPALFIASPTGEEQINVLIPTQNGTLLTGPQIETVRLTQVRDASAYQVIVQAATNVVQQGNDVGAIVFSGATAGTATITTETTPVDGQRFQIFSQAGITTLTLTGSGSQTFANAPTSLAALGSAEFIYQASSGTWYRIA